MTRVVYGEALGQLVFAPLERATQLADLWRVLADATTWGSLRTSLPEADYERFEQEHADEVGKKPSADDPVDPQALPGVADGDFPPSVNVEHRSWMPAEALALGREETGTLGGDWVAFDVGQEAAVVGALEAAGYDVQRDDELIAAASGM